MKPERIKERRVITVSNRLPVKISLENGKAAFQKSEGGLATGLNSLFAGSCDIWIGWPGAVVENTEQQSITEELNAQNLFPVFLSGDEIKDYYEGFANKTLWPLFHYFTTYSSYVQECYDCYVSVNKRFADEIIKLSTPDDIIWIHDYQLMLVPAMVRAAMPDACIGYFQHIPFPDYEVYRAMPWKKEVIQGLLGADTIGFQTEDDVRHFLNSAEKLLGVTVDSNTVIAEGRSIVQAFPISIDYENFRKLAEDEETEQKAAEIMAKIKTKLAISVDRLDYSKGIIQRLQAFDLFLEKNPEWHRKVTLVHLIVPSRDTVDNYCTLKEEMNRLISNINGKHGTFGWQPILHFYQSFEMKKLAALYKAADLAIVTPLRDGMNLVSKEFVASNTTMKGILLLGEAAGAAKELTDAIIVNPYDVHDFADKIYQGLSMPVQDKRLRMGKMQSIIKELSIFRWAESFMAELQASVNSRQLGLTAIEKKDTAGSDKVRNIDPGGKLPLYELPTPSIPFPGKHLQLIVNKAS